MILLIDNYDSFVHNIGRHFGMLGRGREVVRNDAITLPEIAAMAPSAIVLSPGPYGPDKAGICRAVVDTFAFRIPILGICLGHQVICEAFGGRTVRAPRPCHGIASRISHNGEGLFMGLPNPFTAGRYHSLISEVPPSSALSTCAISDEDGLVMAVTHARAPVCGLQFHPESILTEFGVDLLRNFLVMADSWNMERQLAA